MTNIRKLPTKTKLILVLLFLFGVAIYILVENGKETKARDILKTLGHTDIKDIKVAIVKEYLNEKTNIKGYRYTVRFVDNSKNKECHGFVWKDFKQNVLEDLICE